MSSKVVWAPQQGPQVAFCTCPFEEALYGGAAGGGKSDALIGDYASGIEQYGSGWHGVLFRRYYPDLEELQRRTIEIFAPIYGIDSYKKGVRTWEFRTEKGTASLKLRAMDAAEDVYKHYGHQYSYIGFDELTQWESDWWYEHLFTRLRSPKGSPCYMRAASNPGNAGHNWVKERFRIGEHPAMEPFEVSVGQEVRRRVFIPAKLDDNIILMKNDPGYKQRLGSIADPIMRRALMDGDWNIIAGSAFPEFRADIHVIPTTKVPPGVRVWRAMDWGYVKPYGCLWAYQDFDGDIIICGELYGRGTKIGQGSRESEEDVLRKIQEIERSNGWHVTEAYLDPQCWADMGGGERIVDKLGGIRAAWRPWAKGPGSRIAQKQQIHAALRVINNKSTMKFMDCCVHTIRTLPVLQIDRTHPEDIDTDGEDHLYDALRGLITKRIPKQGEVDDLLKIRQYMDAEDAYAGMAKYGGF